MVQWVQGADVVTPMPWVQSLAWELLYARSMTKIKKKKEKKEKERIEK